MSKLKVKVIGLSDVTEEEIANYVQFLKEKTNEEILTLTISDAGNGEVTLEYTTKPPNFERIRRITGYLVGTTERFNNAKQSEEKDRVKHKI